MKSPAFLLYTGDFLSSPDVQLMQAHEVGAYCLLLFNSWQSDRPGYLPDDEDRLRRVARLSPTQWAESRQLLLGKFPTAPDDPTRRHNPRLTAEAIKQQQHRELKALAGKASAAKRATQATGVAQNSTGVQHLLAENRPAPPAAESLSTAVEIRPTPVAPPPNTRCQNGQQEGNLSLSISRSSSLRSEREAAAAAQPAPQLGRKVEKSSGSPSPRRGGGRGVGLPPTLAEVQAHAATAHPATPEAAAEAAAFHDHYQSNGWRVGKNPMTDWPAAFRNWLRRRSQFQPPGSAPATPPARARTAPKPHDPTRYS